MNAKTIGKWLFLIGLLVAVIASLFSYSAVWLTLILILMGILAAILFFNPEDVVHVGIRFLVLFAVAAALDAIPAVGPYLTNIFKGAVGFLEPVVLTLLVVWFVRQYLMKQSA